MGFYKRISEEEVLEAPNYVEAPTYSLDKKDKNRDDLPDGWLWFDTKQEADLFFGIEERIWTEERIKEFRKLDPKQMGELLEKICMLDLPGAFVDHAIKRKKGYNE